MSAPPVAPTRAPISAVGFFGKIPARGDFVRAGLPGSFVAIWDVWLQHGLEAGRAALGDRWDAAWLEAPVWRFSLPPGQCGPSSVLGLWMPSVDSAGRYFPLTIATLPGFGASEQAAAWLDAAEQAGREAIQDDLSPAELGERLPAALAAETPAWAQDVPAGQWWTDGSPFVPAGSFRLTLLPDPTQFAAMVHAPAPAALEEQAE